MAETKAVKIDMTKYDRATFLTLDAKLRKGGQLKKAEKAELEELKK